MVFPEAVAAQLAGHTVRRATLVWFEFASGPIGLHNGFGKLQTKDGREWFGLGGIGSVEGLEQAINGVSPELRLTVSGVDDAFMSRAKGEAADYFRRPVMVFSQFYRPDWSLLDSPFAIAWAQMYSLVYSREPLDDGGWTRSVAITAETPFSGRRRPRNAFLTDRDQQARHPGDRFAERTPGIESKTVKFPRF